MTTRVYANALAALNSANFLDEEKIRRLTDAATVSDCVKMLVDYGYGEPGVVDPDALIIGETDKLIEFVNDNSPDPKAAYALNARFLYNNIKLFYKSRFSRVDTSLVYAVGDVSQVANKDYFALSSFAATALEKLDEGEPTAEEIDLELTRAMYEDILSNAKTALLKKYFRCEIDLKNISAAARARVLGVKYAGKFISGGFVSTEELEDSIEAKNFDACFYGTPYDEIAEKFVQSEFKDFTELERSSDEYLFYLTDSLLVSVTGDKPFLNYYTARLAELKTIKVITVAVKTGRKNEVAPRIRRIYG